MEPVITSVSPSTSFETGRIEVFGSNFESAETLLLVNGISAKIGVITDDHIAASIPLLGRTGVFSVIVMTTNNTQIQPTMYSNSLPIEVEKLTQAQIDARTP